MQPQRRIGGLSIATKNHESEKISIRFEKTM